MNSARAQDRFVLKSADEAYRTMNYGAAIPLYEKLLSRDQADTAALKKLSVCYVKTKDTENAERILHLLTSRSPKDLQAMQMYAKVLAGNGKYENSRKAFERCHTLNSSDKIAENFLRDYKNINLLYKDSVLYSLNNISVNTSQSEFSPAFYKNSLIFVSSRHRDQTLKLVYEFNNTSFLDLYSIDTALLKRKVMNASLVDCSRENFSGEKLTLDTHVDDTRETSNDTHTSGNVRHSNDSASRSKAGTENVAPFMKRISSKYHEGPVSFSSNYDTVFLTRNYIPDSETKSIKDHVNKIGIYYSVVGKNGQFESVFPAEFTTNKYSVAHPALTKDGRSLFFASDMKGGSGGMDIYVTKKINGKWSNPENVTAVNTPGDEVFPYVDENNILYYSSDGSGGLGGLDIYSFNLSIISEPVNMGFPINSCKDDFGILVYDNGRSGYFSSNRNSAGFNDNIFEFRSIKPGYRKVNLRAVLFQLENHLVAIDSCEIDVVLKDGKKKLGTLKISGSEREITLPANRSYQFMGHREPYQADVAEHFIRSSGASDPERINVVFREKNFFEEKIKKDEPAHKVVSFKGRLVEKETGKPVSALVAIFLGNEKNQFDLVYADGTGIFRESLIPGTKYYIKVADSRYSLLSDSLIATSDAGEIQQTYFLVPNVAISEKDLKRETWTNKVSKTNLWGIVADTTTKEPIDAIVKVQNEGDTSNHFLTITDFDGTFSSSLNSPGEYSLTFLSEGYFLQSQRIEVRENDNNQRQFYLKKTSDTSGTLVQSNVSAGYVDSVITEYRSKIRQRVTLNGTVMTERDKEPMISFVALYRDGTSEPDGVHPSDENGFVSFALNRNELYRIEIREPGFLPIDEMINTSDTALIYRRMFVLKEPTKKAVYDSVNGTWEKESLLTKGKIDSLTSHGFNRIKTNARIVQGSVLNEKTNESVRARLLLFSGKESLPEQDIQTDLNGRFVLSISKGKTYTVQVVADGYFIKRFTLSHDDSYVVYYLKPLQEVNKSASTVADSSVYRKIIQDQQPLVFKGTIQEKETELPVKTLVALFLENENSLVDMLHSDEAGNFETSLIPDRKYLLKIADARYQMLIDSVFPTSGSSEMKRGYFMMPNVSVSNNDPTRENWNKKVTKTILKGSVADAVSKEPVDAIVKVISERDTANSFLTITDFDGTFSSSLSAPGPYSLIFLSEGYQLQSKQVEIREGDGEQQNFYLSKNQNDFDSVSTVWMTKHVKGKLTGEILEEPGAMPLMDFVLLQAEGDSVFSDYTSSDLDGKFEIPIRKDVKYTFLVKDKDHGDFTEQIMLKSTDSILHKKVVFRTNQLGAKIDVDSVVSAYRKQDTVYYYHYRAEVIDRANGKSLKALVGMQLKKEGVPDEVSLSQANQGFHFKLRKQQLYYITVLSEGYQTKTFELNTSDTSTMPSKIALDLKRDEAIGYVDSVITQYRKHVGTKVTFHGDVVTDVEEEPAITFVGLYRDGIKEPDGVHPSDENGIVSFSLNRNELYHIEIREPGYLPIDELVNTSDTSLVYHRNFRLKKPMKKEVFDSLQAGWKEMAIDKKAIIYGSILEDGTFRPVPSKIAVYSKDKQGILMQSQTDEDGRFTLTVSPGQDYLVEASSYGYKVEANHLQIPAGSKMMSVYYHLKPVDKTTSAENAVALLNNQKKIEKEETKNANTFNNTKAVNNKKSVDVQTASVGKVSVSTVVFDFNKSAVGDIDLSELKKLKHYLKKYPESALRIIGYSDSVGREEYNAALSYKRAQTVKDYLVRNSISASRISIEGKGEVQPVASNETETGRRINRRVQYALSGNPDTTIAVLNKTGIRFVYSIKEGKWMGNTNEEKWTELQHMSRRNASLVFVFNVESFDSTSIMKVEAMVKSLCMDQYGISAANIRIQPSVNAAQGSNVEVEVFYIE